MAWKNSSYKGNKQRYSPSFLRKVRRWNEKVTAGQPNHGFAFEVLPAFRSVWGRKFVNMLLQDGKKQTASKIFTKTLIGLKKQNPQVSPFLVFFEAVEIAKPAFNASRRRRGYQSKSTIQLLPWWKQYAFALKWFRQSLNAPKVRSHAVKRLVSEVNAVRERSPASKVLQRKFALYQIAAEVRLRQHFRWTNRRSNWTFSPTRATHGTRWWKRRVGIIRYFRTHRVRMSRRVRVRVRDWLHVTPNRKARLRARKAWRLGQRH